MSDRGTPDEQLNDAKRGVVIIVACLVQELEKQNPGFQAGYLDRLEKAYDAVEADSPTRDRLELLSWTRTLLTGFSWASGKGAPFLQDDNS